MLLPNNGSNSANITFDMNPENLIYPLLPVILGAILVVALYWIWAKTKIFSCLKKEVVEDEEKGACYPINMGLDNVQCDHCSSIRLEEKLGSGRFGDVYKAKRCSKDVAVKIFKQNDKDAKRSWEDEKLIYDYLALIFSTKKHHPHPNILRKLEDELGDGVLRCRCQHTGVMEYRLITEYHQIGSLQDYLKRETVNLEELLHIANSMSCGLAFLHTSDDTTYGRKESIAHRDFKSKNVLLKDDLTACIADFGLAIKFEAGKKIENSGNVGTARYMAPELLELAIDSTQEAYRGLDVYALALVLWELVTRCTTAAALGGAECPPPYKQPYEEELGMNATREEIRDFAFNDVTQLHNIPLKDRRPRIKDSWREHQGLELLCRTITECWDDEMDARLTSACVHERIKLIQAASLSAVATPDPTTTMTITNEDLSSDMKSSLLPDYLSLSSPATAQLVPPITGNTFQVSLVSLTDTKPPLASPPGDVTMTTNDDDVTMTTSQTGCPTSIGVAESHLHLNPSHAMDCHLGEKDTCSAWCTSCGSDRYSSSSGGCSGSDNHTPSEQTNDQ